LEDERVKGTNKTPPVSEDYTIIRGKKIVIARI